MAEIEDTFKIFVNIGGDRKVIKAEVDGDPEQIAKQFMKENQVDEKYLDTLVGLIIDQQTQIKEQTDRREPVENFKP